MTTPQAFYVDQHNAHMPHPAFRAQTPDEMYFASATDLPAALATARTQARAARLAANRALSCEACTPPPSATPESAIPP